jgi:hypothetical protein
VLPADEMAGFDLFIGAAIYVLTWGGRIPVSHPSSAGDPCHRDWGRLRFANTRRICRAKAGLRDYTVESMILCDRRAAVLAILMAVAVVACGKAEIEEPPDMFARLGLPASSLPVRWIESPDSDGVVREYYEDILGYEGEQLDVAVRGLLVIAQEGQPPSRHYELTEYRIDKAHKLIGTTPSSGNLTIDVVTGVNGPMTVYHLDGGTLPGKARAFVKFDDALHLADPANLAHVRPTIMSSLDYAAAATKGRVEISEQVGDLLNWKIRLRTGEELVARLERPNRPRSWSVKSETTGAQLRQEASSQDGDFQVFRFKAVEPGWTDLSFDSGLPYTVRVKVE